MDDKTREYANIYDERIEQQVYMMRSSTTTKELRENYLYAVSWLGRLHDVLETAILEGER